MLQFLPCKATALKNSLVINGNYNKFLTFAFGNLFAKLGVYLSQSNTARL
jgi:hypothetical protein